MQRGPLEILDCESTACAQTLMETLAEVTGMLARREQRVGNNSHESNE